MNKKLQQLMEIEGYEDSLEFAEACMMDSVVPGICKNCDYTTSIEPDATAGHCEECDAGTVVSALIIMGLL